jgi:hypothetical protein
MHRCESMAAAVMHASCSIRGSNGVMKVVFGTA